jgi:nicotinate-nucleotide pyrophosphorylase (carboxylating)
VSVSALRTPPRAAIEADVDRALREDLGSGDVTAALLPERRATAVIVAKEPGVLAGMDWAEACFRALDRSAHVTWQCRDSERFDAGAVLCRIDAEARAIVSAERSALNFLQTLSGTATTTASFVAALAGTRTRVLDTRKTVPGLRLAQKYAVRCGGGTNHRIGLYDAFLIKENHIAACGSIAAAVAAARRIAPGLPVEVEVENSSELEQALAAGAERIMLDEFELPDVVRAVALTRCRAELEVSGNVALERLASIAATGVNYVSVGALTKHVRAIDLSLRVLLD